MALRSYAVSSLDICLSAGRLEVDICVPRSAPSENKVYFLGMRKLMPSAKLIFCVAFEAL